MEEEYENLWSGLPPSRHASRRGSPTPAELDENAEVHLRPPQHMTLVLKEAAGARQRQRARQPEPEPERQAAFEGSDHTVSEHEQLRSSHRSRHSSTNGAVRSSAGACCAGRPAPKKAGRQQPRLQVASPADAEQRREELHHERRAAAALEAAGGPSPRSSEAARVSSRDTATGRSRSQAALAAAAEGAGSDGVEAAVSVTSSDASSVTLEARQLRAESKRLGQTIVMQDILRAKQNGEDFSEFKQRYRPIGVDGILAFLWGGDDGSASGSPGN